jgi:inorganic triphosphatase YgiF
MSNRSKESVKLGGEAMTLESEIEEIVEKVYCSLMGTPTTNSERFKKVSHALASYLRKEGWVKIDSKQINKKGERNEKNKRIIS